MVLPMLFLVPAVFSSRRVTSPSAVFRVWLMPLISLLKPAFLPVPRWLPRWVTR